MKPKGRVSRVWTADLAYAVGLIATDGNLSPDKRHINFTTKDEGLAKTFREATNLNVKIGRKSRKKGGEKKYFVVQFGDVLFYSFLLNIGLTPRKSTTIGKLNIPNGYYADFIRGCIDGDGSIRTFKHPESRNLQLRVSLCSASEKFLLWIKEELSGRCGVTGYIMNCNNCFQLVYAMNDSKIIINTIYYPGFRHCLNRKYKKAEPYMLVWRNW